jgi:outer membrane receptor protein involved in Fe transport
MIHWITVSFFLGLLPFSALAQATNAASPQGAVTQPGPDHAAPEEPSAGANNLGSQGTVLPSVTVIAPTPLLGSGVDRNTVPAQNQVFTSQDVTLQGPPSLSQALQVQGQGVQLLSSSGNPFQPDIFYHGFEASGLQGVPQGLAVYVNGVRFNNPFGDTVNWELIPDVAINRINLVGANPVFGLNALGGAVAVELKNGFTYEGGEAEVYGGSFEQIGGDFQYGRQIGNTAIYTALSGVNEDGWRDFQSSRLKQFYGDIGWRNDRVELHLNVDLAQTTLNGPGTIPVELLAVDPRAQFTGPNSISNNYARIALSGNYTITNTTSVQVLGYYDNFWQRVLNGNGSPILPSAGSPFLSESNGAIATDTTGNPIPDFLGPTGAYASLVQQTTNTNGYGSSFQITNTDAIFGHQNHLVIGFSFDGAQTTFKGSTKVGALDVNSRNFIGPGITIDLADGSIAPVRASITDNYYGLFYTDTFDVTPALALNVSGRFNSAQIDIKTGPSMRSNHVFNRFNPGVGLTYKLLPGLILYGGYSESNRAPTPAELTCSNASAPCSLANFFTGDPNLNQVVASNIEIGMRGQFVPIANTRLEWNLSGYRNNLSNDIIFAQSPILGTGFFQNVGSVLQQGFDAGLRLTSKRWTAWLDYSYINATFQSSFVESSPNNPKADVNGNITVKPGDRLPGIPANLIKFGAQYQVTDKWTVGGVAVAATGQYLFGDEANLTKKLRGYFLLNLYTNYQITKNVQLWGLVQNVTNATYYTYGTFSPTNSVPIIQVPHASNTRSYNIGAPIGGFGGLRVTF